MKKIIIIGSPGSGKSTLARALGDILQIEVIHLDSLFWQTGWKKTSREEQIAIQGRLVQKETWIMDGSYHDTLGIRLSAADAVIFLDMPRFLCLWRVVKRHYTERSRPDLPEQCRDKLDRPYIRKVLNFPERDRTSLLGQIQETGKKLTVLHSRSEVLNYLHKTREEVQKGQRAPVEAALACV